jgi:hypothetical protein
MRSSLRNPLLKSRLIPTSWPDTSQPYDPEGVPPPGEHWNEAKSSTGVVTYKVYIDLIENKIGLLDELVS